MVQFDYNLIQTETTSLRVIHSARTEKFVLTHREKNDVIQHIIWVEAFQVCPRTIV